MATIDSLTSQIRALYEKADEDERRRIQEELRDTQLSFDTDWDVVVRVGAGVSFLATFYHIQHQNPLTHPRLSKSPL